VSKADPIIQAQIDKTYKELFAPETIVQKSRVSKTTNGYIFLVAWANASLLRVLVRKFTGILARSEYRLKAQLDDAARSVVANIEEGFARPNTKEYLAFLGFSQASLVEVRGDIQRANQDGFLKSVKGSSLKNLKIDLTNWHEALRKSVISRGIYRNLEENIGSFKFLYYPVDDLNPRVLTYEVFIELINKTAWHLQKLVESLERKISADKKTLYGF